MEPFDHFDGALMDSKLQRRVQRYGWSLAASAYEPLWREQLSPAHAALLRAARLAPGERVLDIACGTGIVSFEAATAVGASGEVIGVDISEGMLEAAENEARRRALSNIRFARMDAESLDLPEASFDVALCALGLMYVPDPKQALHEMRRVLRPGGRLVVAVWGERARCGWSPVFEVVQAEVSSDVCPLFFDLGRPEALPMLCARAGLEPGAEERLAVELDYEDGVTACEAAFVGGPVALAWSRFADEARERTRAAYLSAIEPWRHDERYRIPGEFVVVAATRPRL